MEKLADFPAEEVVKSAKSLQLQEAFPNMIYRNESVWWIGAVFKFSQYRIFKKALKSDVTNASLSSLDSSTPTISFNQSD